MWGTCPLHAPGHQVTDLPSHLAPNRPQSLRGQYPWLGNGGGRGNRCFPTTFILYCKSQSQQMGQLPTKVQKLFGYPRPTPTPVELDPRWGHSPILLDVHCSAEGTRSQQCPRFISNSLFGLCHVYPGLKSANNLFNTFLLSLYLSMSLF